MKLSRSGIAVSVSTMICLAACSASQPTTDASGAPAKTKDEIRAEKVQAKQEAEDAKYPPPPADSPLAKITKGMTEADVRGILGAPTSSQSYQNGKQWIPGYGAFAPDIARTEFIYKGLGLVTFNQNRYTGRLAVLRVVYDPNR